MTPTRTQARAAPLRAAVIWLGQQGRPWTVAGMSCCAHTTMRGARIYAGRLVGMGVLRRGEGDDLVPGAAWEAWARRPWRTKLGGHGLVYDRARREIAAEQEAQRRARRVLGARLRIARVRQGRSLTEVAAAAGVPREVARVIEMGRSANRGAESVAIGRVLGVAL